MKIQIRTTNGAITNDDVNNTVDLVRWLQQPHVEKVSFDLLDGSRLALRTDGSYQIFAGLVNYPMIDL